MSRFSKEIRVSAQPSEVLRIGSAIMREMDLIFEDRDSTYLVFKEKLRFDPFNPVTVKIKIREEERGSILEIEGVNPGEGPYQETHVKSLIFELLDRMAERIPSTHSPMESRPSPDPEIARELELLSKLHARGILTDAEFERSKRKLLG